MAWSKPSSKSSHDPDVSTWRAVPQTPGLARWALGAIPTLWAGTPKVKQEDEVLANLSQKLDFIAKGITGSSTNDTVPNHSYLSSSNENEENDPITPSRIDKVNSNVHGILKTPGTIGTNKNVSFAPGFTNSTLTDSQIDDSPLQAARLRTADKRAAKKGTRNSNLHREDETVSNTDEDNTSIMSDRTRLPTNVPGRFPSPWVSKMTDKPIDNKRDANMGQYFKNTNKDDKHVPQKHDKTVDQGFANFISTMPSDPEGMTQWMYDKLMDNEKELSKLLERQYTANKQGWISWLTGKPAVDFKKDIEELKNNLTAVTNYAKEKDKEAAEYRAQLAEITERNTKTIKTYEEKIAQLKSTIEILKTENRPDKEDNGMIGNDEAIESRKNFVSLQIERDNLKNRVKNLENNDDTIELKRQIASLQLERDNLKNKSNNIENSGEIIQLKGKIASLELERDSLKKRLNNFETNGLFSKQNTDFISHTRDTEQDIQLKVNQETKYLKEHIDQLNQQLSFEKASANERITSLNDKLKLSTREVTEMQAQAHEVKSQFESEKKRYKDSTTKSQLKAETEIADLQEHVQLLTQQVRHKTKVIEKLQKENTALQEDKILNKVPSSPSRRQIERLAKEKVALQEKLQSMELELERNKTKVEDADKILVDKMKFEESIRKLELENKILKQNNPNSHPDLIFSTKQPTNGTSLRSSLRHSRTYTGSTSSLDSVIKESRVASISSTSSDKENSQMFNAEHGKYQHSMKDITMRDASMESSRSTYREMSVEQKALSLQRLQEKRQLGLLNSSRMSID